MNAKILLASCFVFYAMGMFCEQDNFSRKSPYYVPIKYSESISTLIERYVALCVKIEKQTGYQPDFTLVRRLVFTQSCIIRCYNTMIETKSITPLQDLWGAYKMGTVDCNGKRFVYEFCHLIAIVFEQFIIRIVSQAAGQNVNDLNELLDKIDTNIPLDELVDILEQCYTILMNAVNSEQAASLPPVLKKRWVVIGVLAVIVIVKLCKQYMAKSPALTPPVSPVV